MKTTNDIGRGLFAVLVIIIGASAAYSCTCEQISHRQEFRESDAIFSGQVLEVVEDKSYEPPKLDVSPHLQKIIDTTKRYILTLTLDGKFKGVSGKEITLYDYASDSPCSTAVLLKGERYLVYANRHKGRLFRNGLCSRTTKLDDKYEDPASLRDLKSFWFRLKARVRILR